MDRPLFRWSRYDAFTRRNLLESSLILGRTGSGKTSGAGAFLQERIVRDPMSGGLILAPKPETVQETLAIFKKCRRLHDLAVFGPDGPFRCNLPAQLQGPREVVNFTMTMGEVLRRGEGGGGGENGRFWEQQTERLLYNTVTALIMGGQPVTTANMHRFITTAATKPEDKTNEAWKAQYHSQVMERGFYAKKSKMQAHDYQLCWDFWMTEWSGVMDPRTRGNILAGAQGTLFTMNSGIVQEMICGETNISPQDVLNGRWILVNFPPCVWGQAGLLINVAWKHVMQLAILAR